MHRNTFDLRNFAWGNYAKVAPNLLYFNKFSKFLKKRSVSFAV